MKKIAKAKLKDLWPVLAAENDLFVPVQSDNLTNFALWHEDAEVDLETLNSLLPPKDLLFPQSENIFSFKREEGKLSFSEASYSGSQVIFGIRPCDVHSIELLDKVFLNEPVDVAYKNRRDSTILVAVGCSKPHPTCFCTAFDIEPMESAGADVLFHPNEEYYLVSFQSEKGEKLFEKAVDLLEDVTVSEKNNLEKQRVAVAALVKEHSPDLSGATKKLATMFEHPIWEKFYRRCLGCGTCTYLCPTCHCFDIQDDGSMESGVRFRCWDSCMYKEYTGMGHGHNPRPTRKERVRNRFMHKLNYYPQLFNEVYGCVGCGRCVRKCPVNLDIIQVIKEVYLQVLS